MTAPPPFSTRWALFLDVDGTLLEHAPRPDEVRVEARLLTLLGDLMRAGGGAIAMISGRSVADIDRLFAPLVIPVAGQHGTERRAADGSLHVHSPAADRIDEACARLAQLHEKYPDLVVEHKGATLALHFRLAPELGILAEHEMRSIAAGLGEGYELQAGKFVYEIKPSGRDKGSAIAEFMMEPPFAGRVPAFLGDDLTDEYGFALVNASGGHSIKVGSGLTVARWRLPGAKSVYEWLSSAQHPDVWPKQGASP